MTYPTSIKTVVNLRHITFPRIALDIAAHGKFFSFNNLGSYDCGANFLGVLGENNNTCPKGRGATLICTWRGATTNVLHWQEGPANVPNVLYDFNGSCAKFINNDPRYLLPYGSSGLALNAIRFDSDNDLLMGWSFWRGGLVAWFYTHGWFKKHMLKVAKTHVAKLNKKCNEGKIFIEVCRGLVKE